MGWALLAITNLQGVYFVVNDEMFAAQYSRVLYTLVVVAMIGMAYWSHYNAIKGDPGHLPVRCKGENDDPEYICVKCHSDRTDFLPRVHHCKHCGRCCFR